MATASPALPASGGEQSSPPGGLDAGSYPVVSVAQDELWPPNHSLVNVGLTVDTGAGCRGVAAIEVAVHSDEADDATGDGSTIHDAQLDPPDLYLRRERQGEGDGRVYLIVATATCGATSGRGCAAVVVPHSQSKKDRAAVQSQAASALELCATGETPPGYHELLEGTLVSANQPPSVEAGPDQGIDLGDVAHLDGTVGDDGLPNGTVDVGWSVVEGPGGVVFTSPRSEDTDATFAQQGTYRLRLTADDGMATAFDDVTVVVAAPNVAPVVDAGPNVVLTLPTTRATLQGTVSDDGRLDAVPTVTWKQLSGPDTAFISALNSTVTDVTLRAVGTYLFRLSAYDGQLTAEDDVQVTLDPEPPPAVDVEDVEVGEGNEGLSGATIEVRLTKPWTRTVSVDYVTQDGSAFDPCDYRRRYGTLEFAPGTTVATVLVPIVGDQEAEGDEDLEVLLGNAREAVLGRDRATVVVRDDDGPNQPPASHDSRFPPPGTTGVASPPLLSWETSDPDAGDSITHDVYLGTRFTQTGQQWLPVCPTGTEPGPRWGAVAGYDEASDRLVVYGGETPTGFADADLFVLHHASGATGVPQWERLPTVGGPGPLAYAGGGYDPASHRLVVFGGCAGSCDAPSGETWVLTDASGEGASPQWVPVPAVGPPPRFAHAAAYDPSTNRLFVSGGASAEAGPYLDDVWVLDDANGVGAPRWRALSPHGEGPGPRRDAAGVYDAARGDLVLFGGRDASGAVSGDLHVLESVDAGVPRWVETAPGGDAPAARFGASLAIDPASGRLLLLGGSTAGVEEETNYVFADAWMLDGNPAPDPEWVRIDGGGTAPGGRFAATAVWAAGAARLIVFGGANDKLPIPPGDVWLLGNAAGQLPLVSAGQVESTYAADEATTGERFFWRVVTRDSRGAWRGTPAWSFTTNRPPVVDVGSNLAVDLPPGTATLSAAASDDGLPVGSSLAVLWSQVSGPGTTTFADPTSPTTAATFDTAGSYVLRLTARDSQLEASDDVVVEVSPANQAPVVDAGADLAGVAAGTAVGLAGTAGDDGLPAGSLALAWSQVSGPAPVAFQPVDAVATTAVFPVPGVYVLRLTADDGLLSAFDELTVAVAGYPDLVAGTIDPSAVADDPSTLRISGSLVVSVENVGAGGATGPIAVTVFEDRNGNGALEPGADVILGTTAVGDVGADASVPAVVPLDGSVSFAGSILHAFVDSADAVPESDETNNVASTLPACAPPAPGPFAPRLEWAWTTPTELPTYNGIMMAPVVADLDQDGTPEIVVVTHSVWWSYGHVRILDGRTGTEKLTISDLVPALGNVAVGNIDDDPQLEILVPMVNSLRAYDADGSVKWTAHSALEGVGWGGPALADLDGDGRSEIVLGREVLNADGTRRWRGTGGRGGGDYQGPLSLVADLDLDGTPEVVAGNTAYRADGSIYWEDPALPDGFNAIGNFDDDPFPEVVLVTQGVVRLLDHTGAILWETSIVDVAGPGGGPPTVADFDGDGEPEVGVAGYRAYVVLEGDGTIRWHAATSDPSSHVTGSSVFDFDGDGRAEVLYRDEQTFWVFDGRDGSVLFQTPLSSCTAYEYPVIADVDADGAAEALVPASTACGGLADDRGLFVFGDDDAWVATRQIWNEHTYHITNVGDDGSIPAREAASWLADDGYRQQRLPEGCAFARADLVPSFPRVVPSGGDLVLTVRVGNAGNAGAAAGLPVSFYDGDPARGGGLLGTATTASLLAPGAFEDLSLVVPSATEALPLWVVADDRGGLVGTVAERDETNNAWDTRLFLSPTPNEPPAVAAGPDQAVDLPPGTATLSGTADDDGRPVDYLAVAWGQVSGPAVVAFADPTSPVTGATFTEPGTYVLRLTANDQEHVASDDVTIVVSRRNAAPVVDAGADFTATAPQATLAGAASDDGLPEGGGLTLQWTQVSGPAPATLASPLGALTAVVFVAEGPYVFQLHASDSLLEATDTVSVTVAFTNEPPVVDAGPDKTVTSLRTTLAGTAADDGLPVGSALSFQWTQVSGPAPATLASPLAAHTEVLFAAEGAYLFSLAVSDTESTAADSVAVDVRFVDEAPVVDAGPDTTVALPADTAFLQGTASDDGLPPGAPLTAAWRAISGPAPVVFDDPGALQTAARFTDPGVYTLRLRVSDGEEAGEDDVAVVVQALPPGGAAPTAALESPISGTRLSAPVDVVGTAGSDDLASWQLEHRRSGETVWTRFATGQATVEGAVLGRFDPSALLNGVYEIRLSVTDTGGRIARASTHVVVRDQLKVGQFTVSFVDLEIPVAGLPMRVTRTYDSRDKGQGDFGYGWRLDLANVRVNQAATLGLAWYGSVSPGAFASYCLQATAPPLVTLTFPDGRVQDFEMRLTPSCQAFAPMQTAEVSFAPVGPTLGRLELTGSSTVELVGSWPGPLQLFDSGYSLLDPQVYRYTAPDGQVFVVDRQAGLQSLTDRAGNILRLTPAGITSSHPSVPGSEVGIAFERDGLGRITRLVDPDGRASTYEYDSDGDLVSFTDREGKTTRFSYLWDPPHHLETIDDPLGRTPIKNEYDDTGRLVAHVDAFGNRIEYQHDVLGRQEIVTDRNGDQRVLEYDDRGNVLRETDPLGRVVVRTFDARSNRLTETEPYDPVAPPSPIPTTTYAYDAQDNLFSVQDPLGNTTSYTYNAFRQVLTTADARNHTTTNAYDAKGNLLSSQDALGHTTSYSYDTRGNVLAQTARAAGADQVTTYSYDSAGRLTQETDPTGHATSYTYDASGNRLTQTTTRSVHMCSAGTPPPCATSGTETLTTTYEYDGNGRLLKTTDPDGTETHTVYDALGRQVESHDKLGRVTRYEYDEMGRLVKTTYPDSTFEEHGYDKEGRRTRSKDRAGRTILYQYDSLGRFLKTTYPDSSFAENVYDAAGRLVQTKDARGNPTTYEYDSAGRRTRVTDALGHATVFAYDANGNQQSVTDARGNTVTYEYDALNRRTRTIFPPASAGESATFTETGYDELGRRVSETDQSGKTTRFEYDGLGRLTAVVDALDQRTAYTYDEVGNRLSQTDANGHTTWFEYDSLGHQTARILPDGSREAMAYDAAGNLETRTDFVGRTTTYTYDDNNRLLSRTYPNTDENVSFTYSPTGRRLTATDARGTTQYAYDIRDRLTTLTYPDGRALQYEYDPQGNRVKLTALLTTLSLVSTYTFDPLNRIQTVTDPADRAYTHSYDENGNRSTLAQPNGAVTAYTYDSLNRLTNLATTIPALSRTVQSYAFTLGPSGSRTRIVEAAGLPQERTVDYSYDALYRLTGETVTESLGLGLVYAKAFAYDPVGNRLTQATALGPAGSPGSPNLQAGTVGYSYDSRDRLLSEQLDAIPATAYGWDQNGNLTTKDAEATYTWDHESRLIAVAKTDGTLVEHAYDADGNRVRTRVTPPTGPPTVTNFLVDTSASLSQVVAETDDTGALAAYYVRGDDLLAVMRPLAPVPVSPSDWQSRYYHADGLGSIRRLTNEAGTITDGYTYSAFGELLAHTGSDPQPYAFTGEPLDPNSGFQYHRARWMDSRTGRFVGQDLFPASAFDPLSLHRYLYADLDPANRLDPTGRFTTVDISAALGALQTLMAMALPTIGAALEAVAPLYFTALNVIFWADVGLTALGAGTVVAEAVLEGMAGRLQAADQAGRVYPLGNSPRGLAIGEVCEQNLSDTFPKIDDFRFNEGVATSIKSTTQVSSQRQLVNLIAGYAGEFDTIGGDLVGYDRSGRLVRIVPQAIRSRNLLIVVPRLDTSILRGLASQLAEVAETMEVNVRLVQVNGLKRPQ